MERHRERRTPGGRDVNFYTADYSFADRPTWSVADMAAQPQLGILPQWGLGSNSADRDCVITDGAHLGLAKSTFRRPFRRPDSNGTVARHALKLTSHS